MLCAAWVVNAPALWHSIRTIGNPVASSDWLLQFKYACGMEMCAGCQRTASRGWKRSKQCEFKSNVGQPAKSGGCASFHATQWLMNTPSYTVCGQLTWVSLILGFGISNTACQHNFRMLSERQWRKTIELILKFWFEAQFVWYSHNFSVNVWKCLINSINNLQSKTSTTVNMVTASLSPPCPVLPVESSTVMTLPNSAVQEA